MSNPDLGIIGSDALSTSREKRRCAAAVTAANAVADVDTNFALAYGRCRSAVLVGYRYEAVVNSVRSLCLEVTHTVDHLPGYYTIRVVFVLYLYYCQCLSLPYVT